MYPKHEIESAIADLTAIDAGYKNETLTMVEKNEQAVVHVTSSGFYARVLGSNDLRDWMQNLTSFRWSKPSSWPWWQFHKALPGTNHKITSGYVQGAKNIVNMLEPFIDDKEMPIFLGGHSAGGPKAAGAGIMLEQQGYNVQQITTYAAPRFSVTKINAKCFRNLIQYMAVDDVVCEVPKSTRFRNWQHQATGDRLRIVGSEVDNHWGIWRDIYEAHMPPNYLSGLREFL